MNNWEDALPPIVREKLARIGAVTEDDVAKTREMNDLEQIISRFFKGDMDASGLWTEFKKYKNEHKDYLLSETQRRIIDSLSIKLNEKELEKRKEGLIAIETLKDENMVTEVDRIFRIIKELKPRKENEYEQTLKRIRDRFAKKPELRMKKITQGRTQLLCSFLRKRR